MEYSIAHIEIIGGDGTTHMHRLTLKVNWFFPVREGEEKMGGKVRGGALYHQFWVPLCLNRVTPNTVIRYTLAASSAIVITTEM